MPLKKDDLAGQLKDLFKGKPTYPVDVGEAGNRWASAYRSYAEKAMAGPTSPDPAKVSTAESALADALAKGFTAAAGAGGVTALTTAMSVAFPAFWTAISFIGPSVTGVVSQALPGALPGLLAAAFAVGLMPGATAESQANVIASALDTWTRTVMVINTTPPAPPAPPVPLS
jgi:hypothetical protein